MSSIYKNILVTGCPRSGTAFYHQVLRDRKKLDVRHEQMGEDGTVSGFFWGAFDWYPYGHSKNKERRQDFVFDRVEVLVRDPRSVILSLTHLLQAGPCPARLWYTDVLGIEDWSDTIKCAIEIWVRSYQYILAKEFVNSIVRLEDLAKEYPDVMRTGTSFKQYYGDPLQMKEIYIKHPEMYDNLKELMIYFGYLEDK